MAKIATLICIHTYLVVVLICILSCMVQAQVNFISLEAGSENFDFLIAKVNLGRLNCMATVNSTTSDSNNTSTNVTEVTIQPILIAQNDQLGRIFTAEDCSQATVNDLERWNIRPQVIPKPPANGEPALFVASWPFCYYVRRDGEETIQFRCESNTGVISNIGEIRITLSDPPSVGRGFYFGMAPFIFVFATILLCNIILWRRIAARRAQQREAERLRQLQGQSRTINPAALNTTLTSGLSTQAVGCIPVKTIPETGSELVKEICVICQSEFQAGERYKELNCSHIFHADCIDAWLSKSSHCPICITDVTIV